jgi:hypothetical protein
MGAVETVRVALEERGARPYGSHMKLRALCVVHQDEHSRSRTLAVSQGRLGAVLHCFAGCQTADILAALGLTPADLFDEPLERAPRDARTPRRLPPRPVRPAEAVGRVIVRAVELDMLHRAQQAALPILLPALTPDERVTLAEQDSRDGAEAHYWRTLARWAAQATDETYVRQAHTQQQRWHATGQRDDKPAHEQHVVLAVRAEDLAREKVS